MEIKTDVPEELFNLPLDFEPPVKKAKVNSNVPDVDSLTPAQLTVYSILVDYLNGSLTMDQVKQAVPDTIFEDIAEIKMIVLKGYAGTGKTYLITQVLKNYVLMVQANIAVTAPTNKAVKVLKSTAEFNHTLIDYSTIHKLYGLKEIVDEDTGKVSFGAEFGEENNIDETAALILDEGSMLQDDIFHMIKESNNRTVTRTDNGRPAVGKDVDSFFKRFERQRNIVEENLKVVFLGDPVQIPPVGKAESIPFNESNEEVYGLLTLSLTEIIRQKEGNPILELANIIRNNNGSSHLPYERKSIMTKMGSVSFIAAKDKDTLYRLCEVYFTNPRFKHDSDFMKVIAWTNKTVNFMNDKIRSMIYKVELEELIQQRIADYSSNSLFEITEAEEAKIRKETKLPRIMIGEKLVADKPITEDLNFKVVVKFQTNDEFEVIRFTIEDAEVLDGFDVKIYKTVVRYLNIDTNRFEEKTIEIVHEDSLSKFEEACFYTKKAALAASKELRGQKWKFHYMIARKFAIVKYNYAITGHKSQGSTFDNAIVICADIDNNKKVRERNSIKYVAITRPRYNLFMVE